MERRRTIGDDKAKLTRALVSSDWSGEDGLLGTRELELGLDQALQGFRLRLQHALQEVCVDTIFQIKKFSEVLLFL